MGRSSSEKKKKPCLSSSGGGGGGEGLSGFMVASSDIPAYFYYHFQND